MGFLDKVLGRKHVERVVEVQCPHTAVVPRWNNLGDMGKEDLISSYDCTACNGSFTPEQVRNFAPATELIQGGL